jgi:restriction system protein
MHGRAEKGIIITTGLFTDEAKSEAVRDGALAIDLVDRERLIELLERLELGLTRIQTYQIDAALFREFDG